MQRYEQEKERLISGWNTWDTRSMTAHVRMPEGVGINLGFQEYLTGQFLHHPLVGRQETESERVYAGLHRYDGSYTELEIEWKKLRLRVETAHFGSPAGFCARVSCIGNETAFYPVLVVEGCVFWNRPFFCRRQGMRLIWEGAHSDMCLSVICGSLHPDPNIPLNTPYLPVRLNQPVYLCTGTDGTPEQIDDSLSRARQEAEKDAGKYGRLAGAWQAMQRCLSWNLIYEPQKNRAVSNVSRLWNCRRGGYGMFCWDNFFLSYMMALDSPALGRAGALEILNERTKNGFVPNCSNGYGRKTYDRSQPPVGSMIVREIYRREPREWFLEAAFEPLLDWNRWWVNHRMNQDLLSWGSDPYDNVWEMPGIHCAFGAALESGMDNSPMYSEEEAGFDPKTNMHRLWDVGLNSLYVYDCEALADIAAKLGRRQEQAELRERARQIRERMQRFWNEEEGIFCNIRIPDGSFSRRISPTCFYPWLAGAASEAQTQRMLREHFYNPEEFWGEWVLPSTPRNDPSYADNDYWRGRIWAPLNFLVYMGLRKIGAKEACRDLAEKSCALLMKEWKEHGHVHENYNAETGQGDDVPNSDAFYGWGGLLAMIALQEQGYLGDVSQPLAREGY